MDRNISMWTIDKLHMKSLNFYEKGNKRSDLNI